MSRRILGRYIVADSKICHGALTFRGTRIFVRDVLEDVASGMSWEAIVDEWDGKVTREAISEALHLANEAFLKHADDFVIETVAP